MSLPSVSPAEAKRLIDAGAVLVDVRERDEHAREHIPGARNVALSGIAGADIEAGPGQVVLFHCKSGMRTRGNAGALAAKVGDGCDAYAVEGGLEAWRAAGLPVTVDASAPLDLQRQVHLVAGSMALVGTVLGVTVAPGFLIVPGVVGAGLTFAGATGFCGMARLLALMPWNKAMRAPVGAAVAR